MQSAFEAFDLSGRTAVVTGAARGIGRAVALALSRAGANLVVGDLDETGLAETVALLRDEGAGAAGLSTDVSRRADVEALVRCALAEFECLDVMVNIAGIIHDAPVVQTEEADLDRILAVNLKGTYFGCQAALATMVPRGAGSIVNMASVAAFQPVPAVSCYSMSKAAVVALTRVLAVEVGPKGIRVNAVAPGFVTSHMTGRHALRPDGTLDDEKMKEVIASARKRNPLRREGRPEDVAHAVLYLASDASRYVTGQVLHPNGGSYMP